MHQVNHNICTIGDVVYSDKYTCKVTVYKILADGAICDWFDNDNRHHRQLIPFSEIELI